jgi:hypothetical protein
MSSVIITFLFWRHLVKIPESVKDNDKITSETAPDNSSKSDNENKDIPDNLLTRPSTNESLLI